MEHYYAPLHPNYRTLPPWEVGYGGEEGKELMELIYPEAGARIHVPVQLDGTYGQVVLQAAHRDHPSTIHWDLDGRHLGSTADEHRIPVDLSEGTHRLTLTDQGGRSIAITFQVDRGKRPER
jgi:penicillin-binding protein 1C